VQPYRRRHLGEEACHLSAPRPLIYEMPTLKRYLKFKGQVLIGNPMTRAILAMFSET